MIAVDLVQGTPEWVAARVGIPTASEFDKLITATGEPSKQRLKYIYQLAGERVTGIKAETFKNAAMDRGVELEDEARKLYEIALDVVVETVGLCYPDKKRLCACSPDGLVGQEGGLEIKCPSLAVHVGYLVDNKLPAEYVQQVQGNLYVTGRKWWDFVSYYPGLKPLIIRVKRDENLIAALDVEVKAAAKEIAALVEKIKLEGSC